MGQSFSQLCQLSQFSQLSQFAQLSQFSQVSKFRNHAKYLPMLELLRCSTCLDTSSRPRRGRGAVVVTADATWDNRVCEQSVKCTQDEMHTRLQVHSSTAYQLGPGRVLVEMPTVTSCNSRAPAPDCATRDISVLLGL